MKRLIYTTLLVSGLAGVMAPGAFAQQDSTKKKMDYSEGHGIIIKTKSAG
jgi:hypothetical protein